MYLYIGKFNFSYRVAFDIKWNCWTTVCIYMTRAPQRRGESGWFKCGRLPTGMVKDLVLNYCRIFYSRLLWVMPKYKLFVTFQVVRFLSQGIFMDFINRPTNVWAWFYGPNNQQVYKSLKQDVRWPVWCSKFRQRSRWRRPWPTMLLQSSKATLKQSAFVTYALVQSLPRSQILFRVYDKKISSACRTLSD